MKSFFVVALLACLAFPAAGDTEYAPCLMAQEQQQQQQNCCKANKGICGCRAGKIVCCDKTFAEGCTCAREDEDDLATQKQDDLASQKPPIS
jgi:hypothetical protein